MRELIERFALQQRANVLHEVRRVFVEGQHGNAERIVDILVHRAGHVGAVHCIDDGVRVATIGKRLQLHEQSAVAGLRLAVLLRTALANIGFLHRRA